MGVHWELGHLSVVIISKHLRKIISQNRHVLG